MNTVRQSCTSKERLYYCFCGRSYSITLHDKHCPIFDGIHEETDNQRIIVITEGGLLYMKCTHKDCIGRKEPEEGIPISQKELKTIFDKKETKKKNFDDDDIISGFSNYHSKIMDR